MLTSHPNSGGQVQRPPDAQHAGCTWFLMLPGGSTWLPVAATCVSTTTKDRLGAMTAPIFHIQPQNRTVMVVLLVRVIFPQMLNLHLILRFFRATPLLLSVANLISLLRVAPRLCIMMKCQELQWLQQKYQEIWWLRLVLRMTIRVLRVPVRAKTNKAIYYLYLSSFIPSWEFSVQYCVVVSNVSEFKDWKVKVFQLLKKRSNNSMACIDIVNNSKNTYVDTSARVPIVVLTTSRDVIYDFHFWSDGDIDCSWSTWAETQLSPTGVETRSSHISFLPELDQLLQVILNKTLVLVQNFTEDEKIVLLWFDGRTMAGWCK